MFNEFFFFISGSAAVGVSPLECPTFEIMAGAVAGAVDIVLLCTGAKDSRILRQELYSLELKVSPPPQLPRLIL